MLVLTVSVVACLLPVVGSWVSSVVASVVVVVVFGVFDVVVVFVVVVCCCHVLSSWVFCLSVWLLSSSRRGSCQCSS